MTIPSYLIDDFQRFFRISRGTFELILRNIAVYLTPDIGRGRAAITPEKHLLITIWFISHQDTIHRMSDRFSVTDSSIIRCRDRVFTVVLRYLKTKFIYLPEDYNVKAQIMDEYSIGSQFPNVLGAIDGTHIRIVAPSEHSQVYVNRKKFHSLVLQGICASNMQFLHVLAGWPGSVNDSRILRNCDVWNIAPDWCGVDNHLVGDGAYPLQQWLLTPFRNNGHLTQRMRRFNYRLSSARVAIERAFGLLKGRFRRLKLLDTKTIKTAVDTIIVSCIFHNICVVNDDVLEQYIRENQEEAHRHNNLVLNDEDDENGMEKRDRIADGFI